MKLLLLLLGLFLALLLPLERVGAQVVIVAANTSNTGQDGSGNLLAAGAVDSLWQLVSYDNAYGFTPSYVAANPSAGAVAITYAPPSSGTNSVPSTLPESSYVVQNPPGAWATYPGQAQFVSAIPDQSVGGQPGIYVYQFSFTSPVTGTVTFSGVASADNGLAIVYDGTLEGTFGGQLVASTTPGWVAGDSAHGGTNADIPTGGSVYGQNAAPFSYTAAVTAGVNTIDFYVSNFNDAAYSGDEEGLLVTDFAITAVPEPRFYAFYLIGAVMGVAMLRRLRKS